MTKLLAPIILFVYNRLWHTQQTVNSLLQCQLASESELYVFADGPKTPNDEAKVAEVRQFIRNVSGFGNKILIERKKNSGLAQSVINGVTEVMEKHGRAIVLEDDMVFAEDFLVFMNEALHFYQNHPRVFSISGYSYPLTLPENFSKDVYLLPRASSWGWATWADRWALADWQVSDYEEFLRNESLQRVFAEGGKDLVYMLMKQQKGLVNSWAIRWSYTHFKSQAYCLFPRKSKLQNIGNDRSGTHSPRTNRFETELSSEPLKLDENPEANPMIIKSLQKFFKPSLFREVVNYFKLR